MAVIHLSDRHTKDRSTFENNLESVSSYVLVSEDTKVDQFEISLTIGDNYTKEFPARDENFTNLPKDGVVLKPKSAVLFSTKESLRLPYNMFGIVFPKGSMFIRYAIMVPTTKIDPGFHDNLYIFVQNVGSKPYRIKEGDTIASVSFFSTDSTPSGIPETQKPSHKGRLPQFKDSVASAARSIFSRIWELLIALLGGGVLVFLFQHFAGG